MLPHPPHPPQPLVILGSRSPRRRELLRRIYPADRIRVLPPSTTEEASFDGLDQWAEIEAQLVSIARAKCDEVVTQVVRRRMSGFVLTADTTIVVREPAGEFRALGQPPEDESWREIVRDWFRRYYAGRTHWAMTAFCLTSHSGLRIERVVTSLVTFRADIEPWLEWYLNTGEPRGKAGGYALQGAGSIFVERVEGSLSNVVGLPLREVLEAINELTRHV